MTVTQFGVLGISRPYDGIGIGALAEKLIMDPTTLTRNLRPLEQRALRAGARPHDRRSRSLHLTDRARCLRAAKPAWEAQRRSSRRWASRAAALDAVLDRVLEHWPNKKYLTPVLSAYANEPRTRGLHMSTSSRRGWRRPQGRRRAAGGRLPAGLRDRTHPAPPFANPTSGSSRSRRAASCSRRRPSQRFYNPLGTVHGGWISTLLDSAMGCAVHSVLEARTGLHDRGHDRQLRAPGVREDRQAPVRGQDHSCRQPHRHGGGPRVGRGRHADRTRLGDLPGDGRARPPGLHDSQTDTARLLCSDKRKSALPLWLLILIVGTIVGVSMGRAQSHGPLSPAGHAVRSTSAASRSGWPWRWRNSRWASARRSPAR